MKTSVLFLLSFITALNAFAQTRRHSHHTTTSIVQQVLRTTGIGDTISLTNIATDTLEVYTVGNGDSGFVTGPNYFGDRGFAERYDFNANDSSLQVIGVAARFTGKVNPTSTHAVNFKVWRVGPDQVIAPNLLYSGFPGASIDTVTVPVTSLGITSAGSTLKTYMFPYATPSLNSAFYVGYDINYDFNSLNGDTIALLSSRDGSRNTPAFTLRTTITSFDTTIDTILNVQNATQFSDNNWHDNYHDNSGLFNNLAIYPIVVVSGPTSVSNISRGNLKMYSCYPNPATTTTTIKYALNSSDDVTVEVFDGNGRTWFTQEFIKENQGEHFVQLPTNDLTSGVYYYLIRTASGAGMGGQLLICR